LERYESWARGKRFKDGVPMRHSQSQLKVFFKRAAPAAHLWAAFRALISREGMDRGKIDAFSEQNLPSLLGVARMLQEFACTRQKRAKTPFVSESDLLHLPAFIRPIPFDMQPI
jgi:hypothetical protein